MRKKTQRGWMKMKKAEEEIEEQQDGKCVASRPKRDWTNTYKRKNVFSATAPVFA